MDNDGVASLRILTAFLGAIIGCVGCLVGALETDLPFTLIAATGTVICFRIWWGHLSVFD